MNGKCRENTTALMYAQLKKKYALYCYENKQSISDRQPFQNSNYRAAGDDLTSGL